MEGRTTNYRLYFISLMMLVLFGVMIIVVHQVASGYVAEEFNKALKRVVPQGYDLAYGQLKMSLAEREIYLSGLNITPESDSPAPEEGRLYEIDLPSFDIKFESLLSVIFRKELIITDISIKKPQIILRDFSNQERTNITRESGNLLEMITQYLDIFEIRSLNIENAGFKYLKGYQTNQNSFTLKDITLKVKDFAVDSSATRQNFLNARSIDLVINKETYFLPDSIHQLSFDQFRLSTTDSILAFTNLLIKPLHDSILQNKGLLDRHDLFDFSFPEFKFTGIGYYDSYLEEQLSIDRIQMNNPNIYYRAKPNTANTTENTPNPLAPILTSLTSNLSINKLELSNAHFNLGLPTFGRTPLKFTIDSFHVYDCQLQPEDLYFSPDNLPFQAFDIHIKSLSERIPTSPYLLTMGDINVSSEKQLFSFSDLSITPQAYWLQDSSQYLEQKVDYFKIEGIDYISLLFGKNYIFDRIYIDRPKTLVFNQKTPQKDTLSTSKSPISALQKVMNDIPFIDQIISKEIIIDNGSFQLNESLTVERYDLNLNQFMLSEQSDSWTDLSQNLFFEAQDIQFNENNQDIRIKRARTDGSTYWVNNVVTNLDNQQLTAKLKFDDLKIYKTNLDSLLNQIYFCDSINIENLEANINMKAQQAVESKAKPATVNLPLKINTLNLHNSKLQLQGPKGENLNIKTLNAALSIDSTIELKAFHTKQLSIVNPEQDQEISIKEITQTDTNYSFQFKQLAFLNGADSLNNQLASNIPTLRINHWNKKNWESNRIIEIDEIVLDTPFVQYTSQIKRKLTQQPSPDQSPSLPKLSIDRITINNGILQGFLKESDDSLHHLQLNDYDLVLSGLNTIDFRDPEMDLFKMAQGLVLSTNSALNYISPKLKVRSEHFFTDLKKGNVLLGGLKLSQLDSSTTIESLSSQLAIEGLDIDYWIQQKKLNLSLLNLGDTELNIFLNAEKDNSPKANSKYLDLGLPTTAIDAIQIGPIDANLRLGKDTIDLQEFSLSAESVSLDSSLFLPLLDSHFSKLDIKLNRVSTIVGGLKEYHLSQGLSYSSDTRTLTIDNLQLRPLYDKEAYTTLLKKQADYFDVSIPSIELNQLRLGSLFKDTLDLHQVKIDSLKAKIFRDQSIPHPEQATPLIQEQIKQIGTPFHLDKLHINGDIFFSILPKDAEEEALISFEKLDGHLYNITNQPYYWRIPMFLDASCEVFGNTKIEAEVSFDMKDSLNAFKMEGQIGRMDIPVMNQILTPTARIFIKSGINKSIDFEISANDDLAIGDMFFKYNKLKFRIVDKDNLNKTGLGNSILSFWANRLVKSNNPSFLWKRKGIIYYPRNKKRAIFNYWSRSFLSGVISSIGVKNNKKKLRKMGVEELEAVDYQQIFEKGFKIKN